jgi:ERCC4-type nuclease
VTVLIDTREQRPYAFPGALRKTLATADYSVAGLEDVIAIERKALNDFLNCISRERDRFERELQRLQGFPYRALVVEASLADILRACGGLHPNSIIGTIASWMMKYHLPILFAENRTLAEMLTGRLLAKAAKYSNETH